MHAALRLACLLVPLAACAAAPEARPEWRAFELTAGPDGLDEGSWAPLDARVRAGVAFSAGRPEWPCGAEVALQYARAESQDLSVASGADFLDLRVGGAWSWSAGEHVLLLAGAGPRLALVNVSTPGTFAPSSEHASSIGVYAHAGAFWRVSAGFALGVEAQWADGSDYSVLGGQADAGSTELLIALRWEY